MIQKIGLTGNIGSGKSTISKAFEIISQIPIFNADDFAKLNYQNPIVLHQIEKSIGEKITDINNHIDKKKLATIIFNDPAKLQIVNSIIHPLVFEQFEEWIKKQNSKIVFFESAIIFENNFQHHFDQIILVKAPLDERIKRVIERDSLTEIEVLAKIKNQWDEDKKEKKSKFIIENASKFLILPQILEILNQLQNGN